MRGWAVALLVALTLAPAPAASDTPVTGPVQQAALEFGQALTGAAASRLKSLLPERGKVRLHLIHLGPEDGTYSSAQVVALLNDFMRQGVVSRFDILRSESDGSSYALVHTRIRLTGRDGKRLTADVHLRFEKEAGRWVIRGIRETPS